MAHIDEALVGREQREDNYRKWSERAVVVGYNSENQSYDIVVTTERLVGANKRTLNKTIRRVKSILDSTVRVFLPGEAVTIGYLSDKREHPIILGLGDNVVQTPSKVTLGPTLNVEGPTNTIDPDPEDQFNVSFPLQIVCSSDTIPGLTCTIDCGSLSPEITFRATGGVPPFTWTNTDPREGCPFGGESGPIFGPPVADGAGDSRYVVTAPFNAGGFAGTVASYYVGKCSDPPDCDRITPVCCALTKFDCDDNNFGNIASNTCKCEPNICPPVLTGATLCIGLPHICHQGGGGSGIQCGVPQCPSPGGFTALIDFMVETRAGLFTDCRTTAMEDAACCPCGMSFQDFLVTVTDAIGNQVTQSVTII